MFHTKQDRTLGQSLAHTGHSSLLYALMGDWDGIILQAMLVTKDNTLPDFYVHNILHSVGHFFPWNGRHKVTYLAKKGKELGCQI